MLSRDRSSPISLIAPRTCRHPVPITERIGAHRLRKSDVNPVLEILAAALSDAFSVNTSPGPGFPAFFVASRDIGPEALVSDGLLALNASRVRRILRSAVERMCYIKDSHMKDSVETLHIRGNSEWFCRGGKERKRRDGPSAMVGAFHFANAVESSESQFLKSGSTFSPEVASQPPILPVRSRDSPLFQSSKRLGNELRRQGEGVKLFCLAPRGCAAKVGSKYGDECLARGQQGRFAVCFRGSSCEQRGGARCFGAAPQSTGSGRNGLLQGEVQGAGTRTKCQQHLGSYVFSSRSAPSGPCSHTALKNPLSLLQALTCTPPFREQGQGWRLPLSRKGLRDSQGQLLASPSRQKSLKRFKWFDFPSEAAREVAHGIGRRGALGLPRVRSLVEKI